MQHLARPTRGPNGAFHYDDRMLDDGTVVARTGIFTDQLDMTYLGFEMVMDTQVFSLVMLIQDYRPEPDCQMLTGVGATLAMMLATYRDGLKKTASDLLTGGTPTPVGGVADAVLDLLDTVLEGRIPDHSLSLSTGQFPNGLAYACVASGHEFSLPTTPILTASARDRPIISTQSDRRRQPSGPPLAGVGWAFSNGPAAASDERV